MIYSCSVEQILSLLGLGSSASGLHDNVDKSAIYIAGISDATRQVIVEAFGFTIGSLPFRYYQFISIEKITRSWSFGTLFAGLSFGQGVCLSHGKRKKDCLWIQWIHSYDIKTRALDAITTSKAASWVVRKILVTKDLILQHQGFHGNLLTRLLSVHAGKGFFIKKMYVKLMPQYLKPEWKTITLQATIHPRFQFTLLLAAQQRLAIVDRLLKFGIQVPLDCAFMIMRKLLATYFLNVELYGNFGADYVYGWEIIEPAMIGMKNCSKPVNKQKENPVLVVFLL
ncbi:hypothetical protein MTR67_024822 [Solanum verrucosum]|uniref:Uncharacterized protein n=1 Tax=Solanum verrucosum TaxID=315347 RepID=A0AAF0QW15_SOLVR|nr:hypothetical protein MTR67_024822 [Solanum verrucosum]